MNAINKNLSYKENRHFVQIMLEYFLMAITRNEDKSSPYFSFLGTPASERKDNTIVFDLPIQFRTSAESQQTVKVQLK